MFRKLRGKYFTVRHIPLEACGHKMDTIHEPRTNCHNCWWQWLNSHPDLVETADQFYRTQGKGAMIAMRGEKFTKMFGRFMVTLARLKEDERIQNERTRSNAVGVEAIPTEHEARTDTGDDITAAFIESGAALSSGGGSEGFE